MHPPWRFPGNKQAGVCENPQGVLIDQISGQYHYSGVWLNEETICRMNLSVFGDADGEEWKRFSYDPKTVKLEDFGQFFFLEQGFPAPNRQGRPRLFLAVWAPKQPLSLPINVVVFYSPNTGGGYPADTYPYASAYPYRYRLRDEAKANQTPCSQQAPVKDLFQPYPRRGHQLCAGRLQDHLPVDRRGT